MPPSNLGPRRSAAGASNRVSTTQSSSESDSPNNHQDSNLRSNITVPSSILHESMSKLSESELEGNTNSLTPQFGLEGASTDRRGNPARDLRTKPYTQLGQSTQPEQHTPAQQPVTTQQHPQLEQPDPSNPPEQPKRRKFKNGSWRVPKPSPPRGPKQAAYETGKGQSRGRQARKTAAVQPGDTAMDILSRSPPEDPPEYISKATEKSGPYWAPLLSGTTHDERMQMDTELENAGKKKKEFGKYHAKYFQLRENPAEQSNLHRHEFFKDVDPSQYYAIAGTPVEPPEIDPPGSKTPFDALKFPDRLIEKLNRLPHDPDNTLSGWTIAELKKVPKGLLAQLRPDAFAALPKEIKRSLSVSILAKFSETFSSDEDEPAQAVRTSSARQPARIRGGEGEQEKSSILLANVAIEFGLRTSSSRFNPLPPLPRNKAVSKPKNHHSTQSKSRRACDRCRKLRIGCDPRRPSCGRCQDKGVECSFAVEANEVENDADSEPHARRKNQPKSISTIQRKLLPKPELPPGPQSKQSLPAYQFSPLLETIFLGTNLLGTTGPEKIITSPAMPPHTTPGPSMPEYTMSGSIVPGKTMSGRTVPGYAISGLKMREHNTLGPSMQGNTTPKTSMPEDNMEDRESLFIVVNGVTMTRHLGLTVEQLSHFVQESGTEHLELSPSTNIPKHLHPKATFSELPSWSKPLRNRTPKSSSEKFPSLQMSHSQEENFHSRPSVRILVPDSLKSLLVDDWEYVTKSLLLVPLPSKTPVNFIIDSYFAEEKGKRRLGSPEADLLEELVSGLKVYFDKSLGKLLLYRFERDQFAEVRKLWESGKYPEWNGKGPGDCYGGEHFARMLVQMPEIIAQTNMDSQAVNRLREELSKLCSWLTRHSARFFCDAYEKPSAEYIERAR